MKDYEFLARRQSKALAADSEFSIGFSDIDECWAAEDGSTGHSSDVSDCGE